jgi:hypothetical protein
VVLLAGFSAQAQSPGGGAPGGLSGAMTKLFGNFSAFSGRADIEVLDDAGQLVTSTPIEMSLLDKKVRIEMDMARMKGKGVPAPMITALAKLGMSEVISVIRPDKKAVFIFYPKQKMVCSLPMSKEEAEANEKTLKLKKTAAGKATVGGHPCTKNDVVLTDEKGHVLNATTWNASDLNDFPIQIETKEKDKTQWLRFQKVEFTRLDAKLFEPPTNYQQFSDMDDLRQAVLAKSNSGKPGN